MKRGERESCLGLTWGLREKV